MITNNFLNHHSLPSGGWDYSTFQYGIAVSFWGRVEIGYVCTIFNEKWSQRPREHDFFMINQDRHFWGRVCLFKEGEFGLAWMPSFVVGVSDPTTGASTGDYGEGMGNVEGSNNGYFNRNYLALSKHFSLPWGSLGAHVGYQFNRRADYHINAPFAGLSWRPIWLQNKGVLDFMDLIVEYDSRTVNIGVVASLWENRFEVMIEMQSMQWVNFGLRFKHILL